MQAPSEFLAIRKQLEKRFERTKLILKEEVKMKKFQKIQQIYEQKYKTLTHQATTSPLTQGPSWCILPHLLLIMMRWKIRGGSRDAWDERGWPESKPWGVIVQFLTCSAGSSLLRTIYTCWACLRSVSGAEGRQQRGDAASKLVSPRWRRHSICVKPGQQDQLGYHSFHSVGSWSFGPWSCTGGWCESSWVQRWPACESAGSYRSALASTIPRREWDRGYYMKILALHRSIPVLPIFTTSSWASWAVLSPSALAECPNWYKWRTPF